MKAIILLPLPKTFRLQKYVMLNLSTHMLTVPNCRMKGRLLCLNRKLWVQNIIMAHLLFMDIKAYKDILLKKGCRAIVFIIN